LTCFRFDIRSGLYIAILFPIYPIYHKKNTIQLLRCSGHKKGLVIARQAIAWFSISGSLCQQFQHCERNYNPFLFCLSSKFFMSEKLQRSDFSKALS